MKILSAIVASLLIGFGIGWFSSFKKAESVVGSVFPAELQESILEAHRMTGGMESDEREKFIKNIQDYSVTQSTQFVNRELWMAFTSHMVLLIEKKDGEKAAREFAIGEIMKFRKEFEAGEDYSAWRETAKGLYDASSEYISEQAVPPKSDRAGG